MEEIEVEEPDSSAGLSSTVAPMGHPKSLRGEYDGPVFYSTRIILYVINYL